MKNYKFILFFIAIILVIIFIIAKKNSVKNNNFTEQNQQNQQNQQQSQINPEQNNTLGFQAPLDRAQERTTKKPFGIFVTPKNSPVQPERFRGFHTGADFETFPEEANADVIVKAVCPGKLLEKTYASGYGGVAVESCVLNNQQITVVYGHLKLASINLKAGEDINTGDVLGILGKGYSSETNGERKHLHLGFHKGTSINILGYVQKQSELSNWIDPCQYVCGK